MCRYGSFYKSPSRSTECIKVEASARPGARVSRVLILSFGLSQQNVNHRGVEWPTTTLKSVGGGRSMPTRRPRGSTGLHARLFPESSRWDTSRLAIADPNLSTCAITNFDSIIIAMKISLASPGHVDTSAMIDVCSDQTSSGKPFFLARMILDNWPLARLLYEKMNRNKIENK